MEMSDEICPHCGRPMTGFMDRWTVGDRVRHSTRCDFGVIEKMNDQGIHIRFDKYPDRLSIFDSEWDRHTSRMGKSLLEKLP